MALDIKKLKQKRQDAKVAAEKINNEALADGMTAEQRVEFKAQMDIIAQCDEDIASAQALIEAERSNGVVATTATAGHNNEQDKPWANLGEQLMAIKNQAVTQGRSTDPRLMASLGANEAIDNEGGWEIQPEFANGLVTRTFEDPDVLSRCDVMPMSGTMLRMNGLRDDDRSTAAGRFAGLQVYRLGEGKPLTPSQVKYRRIELNAKKLGALFYATDELLKDAPAVQNRVNVLVPQALRYQLSDEYFAGDGETQFLGVQTSLAQVVVAKDAGQAAGTISTANIDNMWNAFWAPSRRNAVWYIQQDLEPQLANLTRGNGTAVELIYTPPGERGNNTPYGLLKGKPVIPVEQASLLGAQGDIMLHDPMQFLVGNRQDAQLDSSMHVAFLTDEMAFRWILRNDGQPYWEKPVTARNSAQKRSPFVTLAARA